MSEAQMWKSLRPALKGYDPKRIETPDTDGTPDVNYTQGWIELKNVDKRPKREDTVIQLDHYTTQQRTWIAERHSCGGRVHLMLRIERTWLLFEAPIAVLHVGNVHEAQLRKLAFRIWETVPDRVALAEALRGVAS